MFLLFLLKNCSSGGNKELELVGLVIALMVTSSEKDFTFLESGRGSHRDYEANL